MAPVLITAGYPRLGDEVDRLLRRPGLATLHRHRNLAGQTEEARRAAPAWRPDRRVDAHLFAEEERA